MLDINRIRMNIEHAYTHCSPSVLKTSDSIHLLEKETEQRRFHFNSLNSASSRAKTRKKKTKQNNRKKKLFPTLSTFVSMAKRNSINGFDRFAIKIYVIGWLYILSFTINDEQIHQVTFQTMTQNLFLNSSNSVWYPRCANSTDLNCNITEIAK